MAGNSTDGLRQRRFPSPAETHRPVSFYKMILHFRNEKLRLPKKFVRMCGHELPTTASLSMPSGSVWHVGLKKSISQIWFSDGWKEIVDYYSIAYGYLLLFKYEGNSKFQLLIFDSTAHEIQYPNHGLQEQEIKHRDVIQISDSVISIPSSHDHDYIHPKFIDENVDQRRRNPKSEPSVHENSCELSLYRDEGKRKQKVMNGVETQTKKSKVEDCVEIDDSEVFSDPRRKLRPSTRTMRSDRRKSTIRATKRFKTQNPSFKVVLTKANIENSYVYIPSGFATEHLDSEDEYMKLQGARDGQQWRVRCYFVGSSLTRRMGKGWRELSMVNNLKVGDIILFELVEKKRKNVLKFTIFPAE